MPYIAAEAREQLDPHIEALAAEIRRIASDEATETAFAGLLNYACTRIAVTVMPVRRYWSIAMVVGVMRSVADEFYRRVGAPYEDAKRREHGDVYDI